MYPLYPAIKPYQCHELPVGNPHVLYLEETGSPEGLPVIVLHSGPGAGADTYLRRFFDPQLFRIINFDQRGSGRSVPHADISHNTTQLLIDDIESIRDHLGLKQFILFGGGWGSLLALLYAQQYPQQVMALLLHQIFLGRKEDIAWLYNKGANLIYPDYWQDFINPVPPDQLPHIPRFYANCLHGDNEVAGMASAKNWALWKARCSTLQPHLNVIDEYLDPHFARALATIETHYINHNFFIEDNQVLDNVHKIRRIPAWFVHGRYDMVCPLAGAWALHQALPSSSLSIVRDAGHSYHEAGIIDALIGASIKIASQNLNAS